MANLREANHFQLNGARYSVTYDSTSIAGEPILTCKYGAKSSSFRGKDIRKLDTEIGQQVTVTLETVPDHHQTTLTVLVPAVNLGIGNAAISFTTTMIITTHRDSIGGPRLVEGAIQSYDVEKMTGTAQFVQP
jgi:hypothetical protein